VGYEVIQTGRITAGSFVGYGYVGEQMNAYGCNQVGNDPDICGGVAQSALTLSENAEWNFPRLGAAGRFGLGHGLRLKVEAAWVPGGSLSGLDLHWRRINAPSFDGFSGALGQTGPVRGTQVEAGLDYALTPSAAVGAGARYWYLTANGTMVFPEFGLKSTEVTRCTSQHFGLFAQVDVMF
jgi:hypothetical protein